MQNFDILVVDDNNQLEKLLNIEFRISEDFLSSFRSPEEELIQEKVGIPQNNVPTIVEDSW